MSDFDNATENRIVYNAFKNPLEAHTVYTIVVAGDFDSNSSPYAITSVTAVAQLWLVYAL